VIDLGLFIGFLDYIFSYTQSALKLAFHLLSNTLQLEFTKSSHFASFPLGASQRFVPGTLKLILIHEPISSDVGCRVDF